MSQHPDPHVLTCEVEFPIGFYEADPMGIVWHGNYINYFERARCALLNKIGYNYIEMEQSGYVFPVTDVKIKYVKPLRFGDTCRAKAVLDEYENLLRIKFELYNKATGELTTKGTVSQMCIDLKTGETQYFCPDCLTQKVNFFISKGGFDE